MVGYGQYPITVLDHANGIATFANRGVYNKAHFVISVEKQNKETGEWVQARRRAAQAEAAIKPDVVDDVNRVLKKYPAGSTTPWPTAGQSTGKTGTWELNESSHRQRRRLDDRLHPADRHRGLGRQQGKPEGDQAEQRRQHQRREPAGRRSGSGS